jgi:hypothetical protein
MTMADEGFFKRWSRRKIDAREGHELPPEPAAAPGPDAEPGPAPDAGPAQVPLFARAGVDAYVPERAPAPAPAPTPAPGREGEPAPPPTMADVALLTPESDFSAFVRQGVDADVRRTALKKLFTDPHFNTMDRLDVYIDDYNKPSPVSAAMLASLRHAKSVFRHLAEEDEGAEAEAEMPAEIPAAAPAEAQADADPVAVAAPDALDAQAAPDARTLQDPPPAPAPASLSSADTAPHIAMADPYRQHPPETETR